MDGRRGTRICRVGFAVTDEESIKVVGYHTLANSQIPLNLFSEAPRRLPRYNEIPGVLLARLAVDLRYQKQGIGELLIGDAILSSLTLSEYSGCRFLLVDAYPAAVSWYQRFGFRDIPTTMIGANIKLFLDLAKVEGLAKSMLEVAQRSR